VVFVNQSGNDGQRDFWGRSFIAGPDGNLCAEVDTADQTVMVSEVDLGELRRQRIKLPFRRDDSLAHTLHLGQRVLEHKIERDGAVAIDSNSSTVAPKPR
jgi:predicted amidohydrolase